MNILEQEDVVKGLPDQVLIQYAQDPTGEIPQFLAVSEIQRREKMRKSFNERVPEETVTEQVISQGIAAMNPNPDPLMATAMGAQPPQDPMMGQQMPPQDPMMQPPMGQQMMPPQDPMMMAAGGGMMPYRMNSGERVPSLYDFRPGTVEAGILRDLIASGKYTEEQAKRALQQFSPEGGTEEQILSSLYDYSPSIQDALAAAKEGEALPIESRESAMKRLLGDDVPSWAYSSWQDPDRNFRKNIKDKYMEFAKGQLDPSLVGGAETFDANDPALQANLNFDPNAQSNSALRSDVSRIEGNPRSLRDVAGGAGLILGGSTADQRLGSSFLTPLSDKPFSLDQEDPVGKLQSQERLLSMLEDRMADNPPKARASEELEPQNWQSLVQDIRNVDLNINPLDLSEARRGVNELKDLEANLSGDKSDYMGLAKQFEFDKDFPSLAPQYAELISKAETRAADIRKEAKKNAGAQALIALGAGIAEGKIGAGFREAGKASTEIMRQGREEASAENMLARRMELAEKQAEMDLGIRGKEAANQELQRRFNAAMGDYADKRAVEMKQYGMKADAIRETIGLEVELQKAEYAVSKDEREARIESIVKQAAILRYRDLEKQSKRSLDKSIINLVSAPLQVAFTEWLAENPQADAEAKVTHLENLLKKFLTMEAFSDSPKADVPDLSKAVDKNNASDNENKNPTATWALWGQ